jgi:hypothetical protein
MTGIRFRQQRNGTSGLVSALIAERVRSLPCT